MKPTSFHDSIPPVIATGETPVLLRVGGLRKKFGGNRVLDGIDLTLRRGEVVLLSGENGSGKTTLLNILTGNIEPDSGTITYQANDRRKTYRFSSLSLRAFNPFSQFSPEFVARLGFIRTWQDVRLFNSHSLLDNITLATPKQPGEHPLVAIALPGWTRRGEDRARAAAETKLADLGLAGRALSSADMISLGQSKRVAIARAATAEARVLFLDEPLAGLDQTGVEDVLDFLRLLVTKTGLTLVIVEHALNHEFLNGFVSTEWRLDRGRLTVSPASPRRGTEATVTADKLIPDWLAELSSDAEVIEQPLPRGAILTRIRRANDGSSKALLEIENLVVSRGRRTVIKAGEGSSDAGLGLSLHRGEIAILSAPNGWGKTTLLMCLAGLVSANRGSIKLNGRSIERYSTTRRARLGLRFVQSLALIFPSLSVFDVLGLTKARANNSLEVIRPLFNKKVAQLSGGQRQLLALVSQPPGGQVHLLDEPFAGLDSRAVSHVVDNLLRASDGCVLIAMPLKRFAASNAARHS